MQRGFARVFRQRHGHHPDRGFTGKGLSQNFHAGRRGFERVHLHSLVYRRLLRWAVGNRDAAAMTKRNAMTAPYLWMLCMTAVVPSVLFWNDSRILGLFILAFGLIYVSLYSLIIRFKSPRWLLMKGKQPPRR